MADAEQQPKPIPLLGPRQCSAKVFPPQTFQQLWKVPDLYYLSLEDTQKFCDTLEKPWNIANLTYLGKRSAIFRVKRDPVAMRYTKTPRQNSTAGDHD